MDEFTPLPLIPEKQAADDSWPPPPPPGGGTPSTPSRHRKNSSSLSDLSMLEVDRTGDDVELVVREIVVATPERTHHHHKDGSTMDNNNVPQPQSVPIPVSTLIVVTDSAQLQPEDASSSSFANMNMSASSPENGGATPTAATKNSDGLLTNKPSHHELLRRQSSSSFPNILHDMIHHATAGSFGEHHTTCDVKDFTLTEKQFRVRNWDGVQGYSDYIQQGLQFKKEQHQQKQQQQQQLALEPPTNGHGNMEIAQTTGITGTSTATTGSKGIINDNNSNNNVVMLFESPSSCTADFAFYNGTKFRFHDWPPPSKTGGKSVLGPCRYALMNGDAYPVFLKDGTPPAGLLDHWRAAVPGFVPPRYVDKITDAETVYAYLPVEQIRSHVNDPDVHYHLAGKDAIHLMTQKVCVKDIHMILFALCSCSNIFMHGWLSN